jgi:hypothetical protein
VLRKLYGPPERGSGGTVTELYGEDFHNSCDRANVPRMLTLVNYILGIPCSNLGHSTEDSSGFPQPIQANASIS